MQVTKRTEINLMSNNNREKVVKYKIITVGDYGIGKTTFVKKYCGQEDHKESFDCMVKRITLDDQTYELIICDTQDMEDISYVTAFYYCDSHGVLMMVDLSNENGLKNCENWVQSINLYEASEESKKPIKFLVGMKNDLPQKISDEQMIETSNLIKMKYYKISSFANEGIDLMMNELFKQINLRFDPNPKTKKKSDGCCLLC